MPVLAGWITGEQVPHEIIDQTLLTMGEVLGRYGGTPARTVQPGAGLTTFADAAYAQPNGGEPAVLDWVPDRRTLVYRRPLSGMHPLYFIENWPAEGNLLFASEVKALFAVGVPRRLHLPALAALARYGFVPAPLTIFKDIQVVPAGSILRWQRAKIVVNHATDYRFDTVQPSLDDPAQFTNLLREACVDQLPPHEQLIALASGSHASTLTTLLTAQATPVDFTIASLGHTQSLQAKIWTDVQHLADACERSFLAVIGMDEPNFWQSLLLTLESPVVDTRSFALHQLLHTLVSETGARIALSGSGANALLASFADAPTALALLSATGEEDILAHYAAGLTPATAAHKPQIWSMDVARQLEQEEPWEETRHARKLARRATQLTGIQRALYLDLHLHLADGLVGPLQQLGTQARLMVRSPYLAPAVVDYLLHLSSAEQGVRNTLLASQVRRLLPAFPTRPAKLPLSIKLSSFTDMASFELLQQALSPTALQASNLFAPEAVSTLLQQAARGQVPRDLLLVFTTQLFYQFFKLEGF